MIPSRVPETNISFRCTPVPSGFGRGYAGSVADRDDDIETCILVVDGACSAHPFLHVVEQGSSLEFDALERILLNFKDDPASGYTFSPVPFRCTRGTPAPGPGDDQITFACSLRVDALRPVPFRQVFGAPAFATREDQVTLTARGDTQSLLRAVHGTGRTSAFSTCIELQVPRTDE